MADPEFDLTIVGGGIVGAMTAWRALKRHTEWRVLWLDRSIFGLGASAYAGALLTPFGRSPAHRALLTAGFKLLPELEKEIGPLPVRELTGWYLASAELAEQRREWFIEATPHFASSKQQADLTALVPHLRVADKTIMGPFCVRQGRPTDFISRILTLCRKNAHFSVWEGVRLEAWRSEASGVRLVLAGGPEITTRRLALATGPWATRQLAGDSAFAGMRVKRVAACHLEVPPNPDAPVLYLGDHDSFLLPLPADHRWLFGFPSAAWDVEPEQFGLGMDDRDRAHAHSIIAEYNLDFSQHIRGGRAFYDCYQADLMPVAMRVAGDPRVVFAGACAGSGFRFSPGLADRALDLLGDATGVL